MALGGSRLNAGPDRYKEVVHAQVQHHAPQAVLAELAKLEDPIAAGMKSLEGMLV